MGYTIQIPSQLSVHLRALRKAKGLSQEALGKRLELSQTRIARIERDPLSISVEQLLRVLAALNVRATLEPLPQAHGQSNMPIELSGASTNSATGKGTLTNDDMW